MKLLRQGGLSAKHYRSKNKIEIWIVNFNYSLRYY